MENWDAETYARVSRVQLEWGKGVLQRRAWKGNETVLDAGCGLGGLTWILAAKVPRGKVYAVDSDLGMVEQARESLKGCGNMEIIHADLVSVKLPESVDVVFSNAVLHWVPDHKKAFANFYSLLKQGGELLAQCGGRGNLAGAIAVLDRIAAGDPFQARFAGWKIPWNFAGPQETEKLLREAGFRKASASLSAEPATFAGREQFSEFVRAVVVWPFLSRLPAQLRERFLGAYLDECEKQQKWVLDYVRLNIAAEK
jgi:trans-aconitate 2-methyltransferase